MKGEADHWPLLIDSCLFYKTEIKKFPNSRSLKGIEILSKFRGMQNGLPQAEAFQLLKELNR